MSFGSRRGFPYTDDSGNVWAMSLDESNIEMVNVGADGFTVPSGANRLPPEIHRRFVKLLAADGSTKTVPVLTRAIYDAIELGQAFAAPAVGEENAAATSFIVQQKIPERILRAVVAVDTGKIDGDQP